MHMQEAGYGSIINMSSMSSLSKSPAISAYAASKAAINHKTANLAHDYGPIIRINAVGPGAVKTGAVFYFAAPVSQWVSGQVLFVNGGGVQTLD